MMGSVDRGQPVHSRRDSDAPDLSRTAPSVSLASINLEQKDLLVERFSSMQPCFYDVSLEANVHG